MGMKEGALPDFDCIFGGPGEVVVVYLFREDGYLEGKSSSGPVVDAILEEMTMRVGGGARGSSGLGWRAGSWDCVVLLLGPASFAPRPTTVEQMDLQGGTQALGRKLSMARLPSGRDDRGSAVGWWGKR